MASAKRGLSLAFAISSWLIVIPVALAAPAAAPVPKVMLGYWSSTPSCTDRAAQLRVTATTAQVGNGPEQPIVYYPNDAARGQGAIHWRAEGNVDNFVYNAASHTIIHNGQGYHMPGRTSYHRCRPL